jgi:cytochrome c oxidase assembly factor CtaG
MMERVAIKMISMWQVDLVIGLAGVAIFYLVQRWRESKERKKSMAKDAEISHQEITPEVDK